MTKLSVNINKFATLRNARGGSLPDILQVAQDCERFGSQGITVHPRPDERHIRYQDTLNLSKIVSTEFNIEGNPIPSFIELVLLANPKQVTLVPDSINAITSNAGWDTKSNLNFLKGICKIFKENNIRTSIFLDPIPDLVCYAAETGADRIELYTESYAQNFNDKPEEAIESYIKTAIEARKFNLGLNAGHDLNLQNIEYFCKNIPNLLEVSIGHALICESIYLGLENTIQTYIRKISKANQ